jgi:hypothetical protein
LAFNWLSYYLWPPHFPSGRNSRIVLGEFLLTWILVALLRSFERRKKMYAKMRKREREREGNKNYSK